MRSLAGALVRMVRRQRGALRLWAGLAGWLAGLALAYTGWLLLVASVQGPGQGHGEAGRQGRGQDIIKQSPNYVNNRREEGPVAVNKTMEGSVNLSKPSPSSASNVQQVSSKQTAANQTAANQTAANQTAANQEVDSGWVTYLAALRAASLHPPGSIRRPSPEHINLAMIIINLTNSTSLSNTFRSKVKKTFLTIFTFTTSPLNLIIVTDQRSCSQVSVFLAKLLAEQVSLAIWRQLDKAS